MLLQIISSQWEGLRPCGGRSHSPTLASPRTPHHPSQRVSNAPEDNSGAFCVLLGRDELLAGNKTPGITLWGGTRQLGLTEEGLRGWDRPPSVLSSKPRDNEACREHRQSS